MTRRTFSGKVPASTAERAPIVHLYKIAPHDARCLGNIFSAAVGIFCCHARPKRSAGGGGDGS